MEMNQNPIPLSQKVTHLKLIRPALRLRTTFPGVKEEPVISEPTEDEAFEISPAMFKIWKNFYDKREGKKPLCKRYLTLAKLKGLVLELYDTKWMWEKEQTNEDDAESLLNSFYRFLQTRYVYPEIYIKVAYDVIAAIQLFEMDDDVRHDIVLTIIST